MKPMILVILIVMMCILLLLGCGKTEVQPEPVLNQMTELVAENRELFFVTDDQAEAEELARLYTIELVEYINGVAIYHTDENLDELLQKGQENHWPELNINYIKNYD